MCIVLFQGGVNLRGSWENIKESKRNTQTPWTFSAVLFLKYLFYVRYNLFLKSSLYTVTTWLMYGKKNYDQIWFMYDTTCYLNLFYVPYNLLLESSLCTV